MKIFKPEYAVFIVVLTAIFIDLSLKNWEKRDRVIEHDVHSYYGYLPSIFIYDDIKIKKSDYLFGDNYYYFWQYPDKNGKKVAKMTCGLSMMYAPFFFSAHFITAFTNYPRSGFSEPYKIFLLLSSVFYLLIALDFVVKILKHYQFSGKHISITILLLGLGTNLLAYSSQSAVNSHVYSFCLFAGFIYNTIKWHERPTVKRIVWLGLLFGLITLIRPSNGLIILFFMLYGIKQFSDLKSKRILFKKHFFKLLIVLPLVLIVWYPQLRYWKIVSGDWIYYSYRDEGFFFLDPKIVEGLFSFRKGWLLYTPIMVFSLAGLFFLKEKVKNIKWATIIFMVLNIYVVFSWWCWWYGGTFGQRVMVESYALLVIPLTSFVKWVDDKNRVFKTLFYASCGFFIWLNIFQTYQFENHSLHHDSMSSELYFKQFGKMEKVEGFDSYLDWVDYNKNKYRGGLKKEIQETPVILKEKFKTVNIKALDGMFWCTEWNRSIIADKPIADAWEEFRLIENDRKTIFILSYDNKYLSLEDSVLVAKTGKKDKAQKFYLEYINDSIVNIMTKDSLWVSKNQFSQKLVLSNKVDSFTVFEK